MSPLQTRTLFVYVQSLIAQTRARVIAHLQTLPEYDLDNVDETALTVLAGVKKDGRDVTIVFRPAYDNTVIIYYPIDAYPPKQRTTPARHRH